MTPPERQPASRPRVLRRVARIARRALLVLLAGFALSWLVALTLAFTIDPRRGAPRSHQVWHPPSALAQTQLWESSICTYAETSWRYGLKRSWGTEQAAGLPDTLGSGDIQTAWASATPDGQREWLTLRWNKPIVATRVLIHQTHNPGAIDSITAGTTQQPLWSGPSETTRIFGVAVSPPRPLDSITLHINSAAVPGWNEIDAVALVDESGNPTYADLALASSSYADRSSGPPLQLPEWCDVDHPDTSGNLLTERRAAAALGWPFPAWVATRTLESLPTAPTRSKTIASAQAGPIAAVPYRPILGGLVLNTLICSVLISLLTLIVIYPVRPVRRIFRMQRGCCPGCGYDLRFNFAAGCSECGFMRSAPDS
jgi:hypothetical protein